MSTTLIQALLSGIASGALYGLIAFRGTRAGRAGGLFVRYADVRLHGAAALALGLSAYSLLTAGHWLAWSVTATVAGLALAYFFLVLLGAPLEAAVISLAAFGLAWTSAAHDLGLLVVDPRTSGSARTQLVNLVIVDEHDP